MMPSTFTAPLRDDTARLTTPVDGRGKDATETTLTPDRPEVFSVRIVFPFHATLSEPQPGQVRTTTPIDRATSRALRSVAPRAVARDKVEAKAVRSRTLENPRATNDRSSSVVAAQPSGDQLETFPELSRARTDAHNVAPAALVSAIVRPTTSDPIVRKLPERPLTPMERTRTS
jgi:hypothetical protein